VSAVLASVVLHTLVGVVLLRSSSLASPLPLAPQSIRVRLVAAVDEQAPMRLRPQPAAAAREENRPPPPQPTPKPKPKTKRPTVVEEKPEPAQPARAPARAPDHGDESVNVQLDGAVFAFPRYIQNIIRQVYRYWRQPTGARHLKAEISFVIERDGTVSDINWIRRSGNLEFDLEARGAVEAAGHNRAFGPLPKKYSRDRLRVSFFFDPASL